MKLILATDHRGFLLKEYLKTLTHVNQQAVTWVDVGAFTADRSDYPIFAHAAIQEFHTRGADGIILLCGSGNGMAIVANRSAHIYACVAWNASIAMLAKTDDNCNALVIPADVITQQEITQIISCWLSAPFKGGRYARRLALIDAPE